MVNVQEWLDDKYPKERRKYVSGQPRSLYINESLEGELDLIEFNQLSAIYVSYFIDLDKIKIKNLPSKVKVQKCVYAQQWLNQNYSKKEKTNTKVLNLSNQNLEGDIDLTGFSSLQEVDITGNPKLETIKNIDQDVVIVKNNDLYGDWKVQKWFRAQSWLDKNYPIKERINIKELGKSWASFTSSSLLAKNEFLQGSLRFEGFANLEKLNCSQNKLTDLDLSDCPKLNELICDNNNLSELDLKKNMRLGSLRCSWNKLSNLDVYNCSEIKEIWCMSNKLTSIEFPNEVKELRNLQINFNAFSRNLDFLSSLVNLESLGLSENNFYGSLKPLRDLSKLSFLNIADNVNIDSGIEYLPKNAGFNLQCMFGKIYDQVRDYAVDTVIGKYDWNWWEKDNFDLVIIRWKKESQEAKEKVRELEVELAIEKEHARNMDKFYRQNPPREDLTLQSILEEISTDYLNLSRENKQLKEESEKMKKELELTEKLVELQNQEQQALQIQPAYGTPGSSQGNNR